MINVRNPFIVPNPFITNHKIFYENFIKRLENNQLSRNYFFEIIFYDQPSCGITNNFSHEIHKMGNKKKPRITIVLHGDNFMILKYNNFILQSKYTFDFYKSNNYTVEKFITFIRKNIIN